MEEYESSSAAVNQTDVSIDNTRSFSLTDLDHAHNIPEPRSPKAKPSASLRMAKPDSSSLSNISLNEIKEVIQSHNQSIEVDPEAPVSPNKSHSISINNTSKHVSSSIRKLTPSIHELIGAQNIVAHTSAESIPIHHSHNQTQHIVFPNASADTDSTLSPLLFTPDDLNFGNKTWQFSLRFPNEALEQHFESTYHAKALFMVRFTSILILLGNGFAGITDLQVYNEDQRPFIWIIRYCAITVACIIYLLFTRYSYFFKHRQLATFLYCVFIGTMLMWISAIGESPNHGTYMVLFNVYSLFFGLNYISSALVNWALFIVYNVWNYFVTVKAEVDSSENFINAHGYTQYHKWLLSVGYLAVTNLMLLMVGYFIESSLRGAFIQLERLKYEQHKTNLVLYNILPKDIAQNLVRDIRSADAYESVSILFCDIYDFKRITASLTASELVSLMNDIYTTFDQIIDRHCVIKIETIGEVYMVAAGLPEVMERHAHAEACCSLAIEMSAVSKDYYLSTDESTGQTQYDSNRIRRELLRGHKNKPEQSTSSVINNHIVFRVGIHSGEIIAGVIGVKLPRYRLFGDTVNTASRMQSTCLPSRIQVSAETHQFVKNAFIWEDRGEIQVKGKGLMHTYLLKAKLNTATQRLSINRTVATMNIAPNSTETGNVSDILKQRLEDTTPELKEDLMTAIDSTANSFVEPDWDLIQTRSPSKSTVLEILRGHLHLTMNKPARTVADSVDPTIRTQPPVLRLMPSIDRQRLQADLLADWEISNNLVMLSTLQKRGSQYDCNFATT